MANIVKPISTSDDLSTAEEWYLTVRCTNTAGVDFVILQKGGELSDDAFWVEGRRYTADHIGDEVAARAFSLSVPDAQTEVVVAAS